MGGWHARALAVVAVAALATSADSCGTFHRTKPAPIRSFPGASAPRTSGLRAYWIGHATVLVGFDDRWVITDPVFSREVGGLARRYYAPGVALQDLPPLDLVLLSHAHRDHLDVPSLRKLDPRAVVICPPAACRYVPRRFRDIVPLRPWQTAEIEGMQITAVPARHPQSRHSIRGEHGDGGAVGYVVAHHGSSFYFAGDTGFDRQMFVAIGRRFPVIDLALLPVGPVNGWLTRHVLFRTAVHMNPEEAVVAFRILGARYMIPIHWHTFFKSTPYESERIHAATLGSGRAGDIFILEIGQALIVPGRGKNRARRSPFCIPPCHSASAP